MLSKVCMQVPCITLGSGTQYFHEIDFTKHLNDSTKYSEIYFMDMEIQNPDFLNFILEDFHKFSCLL